MQISRDECTLNYSFFIFSLNFFCIFLYLICYKIKCKLTLIKSKNEVKHFSTKSSVLICLCDDFPQALNMQSSNKCSNTMTNVWFILTIYFSSSSQWRVGGEPAVTVLLCFLLWKSYETGKYSLVTVEKVCLEIL